MSQKNICVPFSSKYEYMSSFHFADVVKDVRVSCNSEDITLTISTYLDQFNGLVYPKGLSKNSTCMTEYIQEGSTITYVLTLRSCNTMSTDVVSYYITSVVKKSSHLLNVESESVHRERATTRIWHVTHKTRMALLFGSLHSRTTGSNTSTRSWCSRIASW